MGMHKWLTLSLWVFLLPGLGWSQTPTPQPQTKKAKRADVDRMVVYVPYRKVGADLKREGIYLTKKQFQSLMNIVKRAQRTQRQRIPIQSLLSNSLYTLRFQGDRIFVQATLTLKLLTPHRLHHIALPFAGLPLLSAHLDKQRALLVAQPNKPGYTLLAKGKGEHTLTLLFAGKVAKRRGWYTLPFHMPPTPQTKLVMTQANTQWQFLLNGQPWKGTQQNKQMVYANELGPQRQWTLQWRPKTKGTIRKQSMMSARVRIEAQLDEGVLRTHANVRFTILQGTKQQLVIHLPQHDKLLAVKGGSNLQKWRIEEHKNARKLVLQLRKPTTGVYHVQLQFERLALKGKSTRKISTLRIEKAQWQHGWIALTSSRTLELKVTSSSGLTQLDPEEYATQHKSPTPELAFMYLNPRYTLLVDLQKIKPRLRATSFHRVQIDDKEAILHSKIRFRIERTGVFRLRFRMPKGWKMREVRCPSMQNYYLENNGQLVVTLTEKHGGPVLVHRLSPWRLWSKLRQLIGWDVLRQLSSTQRTLLRKRLSRKQTVAQLQQLFGHKQQRASAPLTCTLQIRRNLSPKGLPLNVPRPLDVETEKGLIGVAVPEHLELLTSKRKGLMRIDNLDEASAVAAGKYALRQAFRYVVPSISTTLQLKPKKSAINANIWLPVQLKEDGYRIRGTIRYHVRFAGVKTLSLRVPLAYAKRLQILSRVRETRRKKDKKHVLYTFVLNRKVPKGNTFSLRFMLIGPFQKALRVGQLEQLTLPSFSVPHALEQTTYWGLQKGESLSMQVMQAEGYERIDASDLPSWATPRNVSRTLKSPQKTPKPLKLLLRKHHYARVLSTIISHLHVEAVVNRDGNVQALAILQLKNRGRQFLKLTLPPKSRIAALHVAGKERYRFELDQKGELLVDLANHTNGNVLSLVIKYQHPLPHKQSLRNWSGTFRVQGPIAIDTPIAQTSSRIYLPKGNEYPAFDSGSWHSYEQLGLWSVLRAGLWGRDSFGYNCAGSPFRHLHSRSRKLLNQLPGRGPSFSFCTQSQQLNVSATYRTASFQRIVDFFVGFLVFLLLFWLAKRDVAWRSPLHVSTTAFLVLLLASALLPSAWINTTYAALFSWAALSAFWITRRAWLMLPPLSPNPIDIDDNDIDIDTTDNTDTNHDHTDDTTDQAPQG